MDEGMKEEGETKEKEGGSGVREILTAHKRTKSGIKREKVVV